MHGLTGLEANALWSCPALSIITNISLASFKLANLLSYESWVGSRKCQGSGKVFARKDAFSAANLTTGRVST